MPEMTPKLSKKDKINLSKAWMLKNIKDGNYPTDFHACPACNSVVCSSSDIMFCNCTDGNTEMIRLSKNPKAAKLIAGRYYKEVEK